MEEGTIVHVDYELYNGESGDLIETTREAVAKEHETHQEGRSYSPMVCVVGGGNLIPGFEAALAAAKANKTFDVLFHFWTGWLHVQVTSVWSFLKVYV